MKYLKFSIVIIIEIFIAIYICGLCSYADFTISENEVNVEVGQNYQIVVDVYGVTDEVSARALSPNIAKINENGEITGLADGVTYIIFTSSDGSIRKHCIVTVGTGKSTIYSIYILLAEAIIAITIILIFMISYKKFVRKRIYEEKRLEEQENW